MSKTKKYIQRPELQFTNLLQIPHDCTPFAEIFQMASDHGMNCCDARDISCIDSTCMLETFCKYDYVYICIYRRSPLGPSLRCWKKKRTKQTTFEYQLQNLEYESRFTKKKSNWTLLCREFRPKKKRPFQSHPNYIGTYICIYICTYIYRSFGPESRFTQ